MKKILFITIDTEEDEWGSIGIREPSVNNIKQLLKLQELFNKYDVIPSYLINYPVATHAHSRRVLDQLIRDGRCEIGTHCHPWNTPPFTEEQTKFNSFLSNLPYDLLKEKITVLHDTIGQNFGIKPKVFRAGRWGLDKKVLRVIEDLDYIIDTSITPFRSWDTSRGPDFRCTNNNSFYISQEYFDTQSIETKGKILEIPPTMGYLQGNVILIDSIRRLLSNSFLKFLKINGIVDSLGIINYRWLSPETSSTEVMVRLANRQFTNRINFINMFFHSNSLIPGQTPFVKNTADLENFYDRIESFLQYTVKMNIQSAPLSLGLELCEIKH